MEPRGCNQWQPVANRTASKPADIRETVAGGYDLLPESFHGKEGVSGSSPEEGSAKAQQIGFPYPSRVGPHGHAAVIDGFQARSVVARFAALDLA
jgi:hypothetical protein